MFDDVFVVQPSGVWDIYPARKVLAQEGETETQGAGAWDGLACGDSALFYGDAVSAKK